MNAYGTVTESGAVRFERLLNAPIDQVWDYLVRSELRRTWFASGEMELRPGGTLVLIFRNSELAPAGEEMPEKYRQYEGMESTGTVVAVDPPNKLVFDWHEGDGQSTEVSWELESRGEQTLFVLTHRRLPSRAMTLDVSGGWHLHLDVLEDVLDQRAARPFWTRQESLEAEYDRRIPI
jgi:uncharacterized protein YndB with AHSA1/START domain